MNFFTSTEFKPNEPVCWYCVLYGVLQLCTDFTHTQVSSSYQWFGFTVGCVLTSGLGLQLSAFLPVVWVYIWVRSYQWFGFTFGCVLTSGLGLQLGAFLVYFSLLLSLLSSKVDCPEKLIFKVTHYVEWYGRIPLFRICAILTLTPNPIPNAVY